MYAQIQNRARPMGIDAIPMDKLKVIEGDLTKRGMKGKELDEPLATAEDAYYNVDCIPEKAITRKRLDVATEALRRVFCASLFKTAFVGMNFNRLQPENQSLCKWVQKHFDPKNLKRQFFLIELPRDTYKSTIFSQALPFWSLINNSNLSILVANKVFANATNWVRNVRRKFESKEVQAVFGNEVNLDDVWQDSQFVIRSRKTLRAEPSLRAIGMRQSITSQHYDIVVADDIAGPEDRDSSNEREATLNFFKELIDVLNKKTGVMFIVGTRWHVKDIYNFLETETMPAMRKVGADFHLKIIPAERDGKIFFPNILSKQALDEVRAFKHDIVNYSCQYLLKPISPTSKIFLPEAFKYFDINIESTLDMTEFYLNCDPALSEDGSACYSAIVVVGVRRTDGARCIVYASMEQRRPTKLKEDYLRVYFSYADLVAKKAAEIQSKYASGNELDDRLESCALTAFCEGNGFQSVFSGAIEEEGRRRGREIDIRTYTATGNKYARIVTLERHITNGSLLFREDWRTAPEGYKILLDQFENFPQDKMDGPDCLEQAIKASYKGTPKARFL